MVPGSALLPLWPQGRFSLDIGERFFMGRVVQPCAHPWRDLTALRMWHLGTRGAGGGLGSAGGMAEVGVLRGLFQPKQLPGAAGEGRVEIPAGTGTDPPEVVTLPLRRVGVRQGMGLSGMGREQGSSAGSHGSLPPRRRNVWEALRASPEARDFCFPALIQTGFPGGAGWSRTGRGPGTPVSPSGSLGTCSGLLPAAAGSP